MLTRKTRQAMTLQKVLREQGTPLSVDQIWEQARQTEPAIGIATVYRHLARWIRDGWLVLVEIPGQPARYEIAGKSHHHHFVCERCGVVFELPGCVAGLDSFLPEGFHARRHELSVFGACGLCSLKKENDYTITH